MHFEVFGTGPDSVNLRRDDEGRDRMICVSPLCMLLFTDCVSSFTPPSPFVGPKKHRIKRLKIIAIGRNQTQRGETLNCSQQVDGKEGPKIPSHQVALFVSYVHFLVGENNFCGLSYRNSRVHRIFSLAFMVL